MILSIETDWEDSRSRARPSTEVLSRSIFDDMCYEERWYNCFSRHIQPYQKLNELRIFLRGWRDPHAYRSRYRTIEDWMMWRLDDERTLRDWRKNLMVMWYDHVSGIKKVSIIVKEDDGLGPSKAVTDSIQAMMMRHKSWEEERIPKKRVALDELLGHVRKQRG